MDKITNKIEKSLVIRKCNQFRDECIGKNDKNYSLRVKEAWKDIQYAVKKYELNINAINLWISIN